MFNVERTKRASAIQHLTLNIQHLNRLARPLSTTSSATMARTSMSTPALRRLSPADLFALAVACMAVVAAVVAGRIPRGTLAGTPLCWSVILFHHECPGCGLTRSFAAIGRGAIGEANTLNPLGPILFAWAIAVILIRCGKALAPRFRYWSEIDIAFAAAALLSIVTRSLLFYLG
jgi:Protein of unknown function (DUF2752)